MMEYANSNVKFNRYFSLFSMTFKKDLEYLLIKSMFWMIYGSNLVKIASSQETLGIFLGYNAVI